jgi:GT2 family glycosyltransferase
MGTGSKINVRSVPKSDQDKLNVYELSVCIVTYQARDWLRRCLESLYQNTQLSPIEIIIVDNGSVDGVREMLEREFPRASFIGNDSNQGYTRPMNQALQEAQGRYLLQLNPDTVILPEALDRLVHFMGKHPQAGICGPKVLNPDDSLQKQCRRGEPRPLAVISYFLGLSKLFPNNKQFGEYLLEYVDEDQTVKVAAVSGSCMLIRREVVDQIGYLDEQFYAYQEDTDYCTRARKAGWEVFYLADSQIIHYGGKGGSRVEPFRSIVEWHRSYLIYYRKHLARDYFFLFNWFFYFMIILKLSVSLIINLFRRERYAGPKR